MKNLPQKKSIARVVLALALSIFMGGAWLGSPSAAHASILEADQAGPTRGCGISSLNCGLVGYWTFNNQDMNWKTNQALDVSGGGNNGTLIGMSTTTSPVPGKMGQALSFPATAAAVKIANEIADSGSALTVSFWLKENVGHHSQDDYITKGRSSAASCGTNNSTNLVSWVFVKASNDLFDFCVWNSSGTASFAQSNTTYTVANKWELVTGVYDGAHVTVYINGIPGTPVAATGSFQSTPSYPLCIGAVNGDSTGGCNVSGNNDYIDDIRIYSRALSAVEVKQLYLSGQQTLEADQAGPTRGCGISSLNCGLIGYWTFNNQDMNWTKNQAVDVSGNGNTGTLTSMSTTTSPVPGKIGQALSFNGTSSFVDVPGVSNLTTGYALSAWVYPTLVNENSRGILGKGSGTNGFVLSGGTNNDAQCNAPGISTSFGPVSGLLPLNKWSFLTCTWNGSVLTLYINAASSTSISVATVPSGSTDFFIGKYQNNLLYQGSIDDARVYNRVLSAAEVKQLYLSGQQTLEADQGGSTRGCGISSLNCGLVGYWTFNNQDMNWKTNQALDVSGGGNNGTLIGMSTTTSPVPGKMGQALLFNGGGISTNSDFIGTNPVTACFWMYPSAANSGSNVVITNGQYILSLASSQRVSLKSNNATSAVSATNSFNFNAWSHVCVSRDASALTNIYINGSLSGSANQSSGAIAGGSTNVFIGNRSGLSAPYFGSLDDVRLYNRVLSAKEIKQLYISGL